MAQSQLGDERAQGDAQPESAARAGRSSAGLLKPDPLIYELACSRLGVRPEEVIFLDDTPAAVEGARQARIHALLFHATAQAIAAIEALLSGRTSPL
ncbi:MAG: HAD-IA family hydrolase [Streptosporangiaceae bacterium]